MKNAPSGVIFSTRVDIMDSFMQSVKKKHERERERERERQVLISFNYLVAG